MELTTPTGSTKTATPTEIMESAKRELEKIQTANADISWYNPADSSEQLVKFKELSPEKQQAITKALEAFQEGDFITLNEYEKQIDGDS